MRMRAVAMSLALLAAPALAETPKPVAFTTSVKVVLDATGKPSQVEPDEKLPELLRAQLQRQVGEWRFTPPQQAGAAVEAVTYVALGVCAAVHPTDPEQLNVAIDYRSNGPQPNGGLLMPPRYPVGAARAGYSVEMQVEYIVQPDGRATLEGIEFTSGGKTASQRKYFSEAVREWVKQMRYSPELIAGIPVSTRLRTPVDFWVEPRVHGQSLEQRIEQHQENRMRGLAECAAATGESGRARTLVLDSRIQRLPSGS